MTNPFSERAPISFPASPKTAGSADRCVPLTRTYALLPELRRRYGITRVGDTTLLDRTGFPTYCAIVPESPDLISVYNGKGRTHQAAAVSAVMEAVERQIAAAAPLDRIRMPVHELLLYLDLDTLGLYPGARDLETEVVAGTDLVSGAVIPVPLALVQCPWYGERLFPSASSNGLASGNTVAEATYHALTEIVERHIWSLFYVRSQLVPRFYLGAGSGDIAHAKEIRRPTGVSVLDDMLGQIDETGMGIRLLALEEPGLPIVVLASLTESDTTPPLAHTGVGCSLSPAHAAERALTECVQSRVIDIQAAREDILRHDEPEGIMGSHARRKLSLPKGRWYHDLPTASVEIAEIDDLMSGDIAVDIETIVRGMTAYGIHQIAVVDLSPKDLPISVVRVVAPLAETTTIDRRIGPLARREFNPFYVRGA